MDSVSMIVFVHRDKTTSKDPDIESRRQLFEEIFSTLSSIGTYIY